jgi:pseudouridine-5'-phosphate glycosidase
LGGIEVFATGGIGGVHRGVAEHFDISADLNEFGESNVITVCAGVKAILDIAKTLEMLETGGVPVIGYGTDEFPAFWSRKSGLPCPLRLDIPGDIARLWQVRRTLGQPGGVVIANPVPEADEIPADEISAHIERAVAEAHAAKVTGKAVTPWLLERILELTEGRSLATNIALAKNNARLAGEIAIALAG